MKIVHNKKILLEIIIITILIIRNLKIQTNCESTLKKMTKKYPDSYGTWLLNFFLLLLLNCVYSISLKIPMVSFLSSLRFMLTNKMFIVKTQFNIVKINE